MSPVRHIPSPRPLAVTLPGERLPGSWRFSSHLALVLAGGGARGAYQVGVLAGLAERLPGLEFPILAGMSVGAINTIYLAAHPGPLPVAVSGLRAEWACLTSEAVYRVRPARLARSVLGWAWQRVTGRHGQSVVRGLADTQPLREFLTQRVDLRGIEANVLHGRLRSVALSAISYTTGRSVTFVQGTPDSPIWERAQRIAVRTLLTVDHVMASAALPIVFPAVRIGDEFYGDGSVRQMAPLAPALHLGARAVLAIGLGMSRARGPLRGGAAEYPSAAESAALLFQAIFLDALEADAERLERVNQLLAVLPPGTPAPDGLRPIELLLLHPTRDLGTLAAGQGRLLPPGVRRVLRAMGGHRDAASELLGFLLMHPAHTSRLMEVGYEDVAAQWPQIERFFEKLERAG